MEEQIKIADHDWAKSQGDPNQITDIQRLICSFLGLANEKPWMVNLAKIKTILCPVCQSDIREGSIVCRNCSAILNHKEFKKFQFAGGPNENSREHSADVSSSA